MAVAPLTHDRIDFDARAHVRAAQAPSRTPGAGGAVTGGAKALADHDAAATKATGIEQAAGCIEAGIITTTIKELAACCSDA